jgi:hypothetical protein
MASSSSTPCARAAVPSRLAAKASPIIYGLVVAGACTTANVADNTFQGLMWNDRILVETVLSMLTLVCHFKKVMHRVWTYFHCQQHHYIKTSVSCQVVQ